MTQLVQMIKEAKHVVVYTGLWLCAIFCLFLAACYCQNWHLQYSNVNGTSFIEYCWCWFSDYYFLLFFVCDRCWHFNFCRHSRLPRSKCASVVLLLLRVVIIIRIYSIFVPVATIIIIKFMLDSILLQWRLRHTSIIFQGAWTNEDKGIYKAPEKTLEEVVPTVRIYYAYFFGAIFLPLIACAANLLLFCF